MARFAHGDQPDVDLDLPIDEAASPSVAPASPSTMPSEETLPANQTTTTRPIGSSFSDLGATFNGMARPPMDASSQNALDQGGQRTGSMAHHANDLTTVQNNVLAELNTGQFSGAALGHVQAILSDLNSAISAANASVSTAGSFGNAAGAEQALRASQLSIINTVNTDPVLANPAPAAPLPTGPTAAAAPHNLAEIGAMFDDVANQILGGVNDGNRTQITDDINALISDMEALIAAKPELFDGLTGVHADKIVQQLQLELVYINDPSISPSAAQASTDNILDIIDIVQSDINLADMATQDGINGFSPFPDATNLTPHLDNDVQTVFAASFIAQSNSLGQQAIDLVGSGDARAIATLIDDLKAFEKYVTDFDAAQGGNELLDATSTLGAEVAAMIKGLQTGNAALVTAAADQMHGNAADIGGSNVPVTGGTYNTDGVTVAEVLGTPAAAAAPAEQQVVAPTISAEAVTIATADIIETADHAQSDMPELAHHLHHMWG
jgi:hypothetical protein